MIEFIESYFRKVKRTIEFIPIIWKGFDFDYRYAVDLFQYQLTRTAKFLESDRAISVGSKERARRLRTITELMDRVYDSYYELEHFDQMEERWGTSEMKWEPYTSNTSRFVGLVWSKATTEQEQIEANRQYDILRDKAMAKHLRAKKLLWKLVEHNLEYFWD
jgi:hypothetical protein